MEPKNFSSPDATEKSREARLSKLRERRTKAVTSNSDTAIRTNTETNATTKMRMNEPLGDPRFSSHVQYDRPQKRTPESRLKPLPSRQGRLESRSEQRPENVSNLRGNAKTELGSRRRSSSKSNSKSNTNRPIPIRPTTKSPVKVFGWQLLRLGIAAIGLSVIAGTFISWQGQQSSATKKDASETVAKEEKKADSTDIAPINLKNEESALLTKIKSLAATEADLGMQMMVVELDSGAYVQVGADKPIAAASTIKTPLLVAFLQDVDAGKIKLDEPITMTKDVIVGEAGDFQLLDEGTKISALEVATQMIVISDNTATNMIIKRLGGIAAVNTRFKSWGLNNIVIRNQLPDLEGTNTISTRDMVSLLSMIDQGNLLAPRSRDRFMDIMRRPVTNTLLPRGIAEDARIIHKTGDIGSAVGDAGIVDMPNGQRYAIAVMVTRPHNDQRANELIRQISRTTYDYFSSGGKLSETNAPEQSSPDAASPSDSGTSTIENIVIPLPNTPQPNREQNTDP